MRGQPLTLRCRACGRRNVGTDRPIRRRDKFPLRKRKSRFAVEVECVCGWSWISVHRSLIAEETKP